MERMQLLNSKMGKIGGGADLGKRSRTWFEHVKFEMPIKKFKHRCQLGN